MTIRKSEYFISDVEQQFQWYLANANDKIADRYLDAVEATCQLLKHHPLIGPQAGFSNPKLHDWRFIVVLRPFQKHILFYEIVGSDVLLRRAMHGHRDLPGRLIEPN
jgi:plasmid stabilization system protein ParE